MNLPIVPEPNRVPPPAIVEDNMAAVANAFGGRGKRRVSAATGGLPLSTRHPEVVDQAAHLRLTAGQSNAVPRVVVPLDEDDEEPARPPAGSGLVEGETTLAGLSRMLGKRRSSSPTAPRDLTIKSPNPVSLVGAMLNHQNKK